jgi:hypothetical protein
MGKEIEYKTKQESREDYYTVIEIAESGETITSFISKLNNSLNDSYIYGNATEANLLVNITQLNQIIEGLTHKVRHHETSLSNETIAMYEANEECKKIGGGLQEEACEKFSPEFASWSNTTHASLGHCCDEHFDYIKAVENCENLGGLIQIEACNSASVEYNTYVLNCCGANNQTLEL